MSWRLTRDGEPPYYLLPTSVCRVGRQGCQVLISDTTVSRHHADFTVTDVCTVKDVSKFVQTFVNKEPLTREERILKNGDVLTFGASDIKFVLTWDPIVLFSNTLSGSDSSGVVLVKDISKSVSGYLIDSDYLSQQSVSLVTAIAFGTPLVDSNYLHALAKTESGVRELPDMALFTHQVPTRKSLFSDIHVLSSDIALKQLVVACGGSWSTSYVGKKYVCRFAETFSDKASRIVSEDDILHAILINSTEDIIAILIVDKRVVPQEWIGQEITKPNIDEQMLTRKAFKRLYVPSDEHVSLQAWNKSAKRSNDDWMD